MFKIIHTSKDGNSISIRNLETTETKAFIKVLVGGEGEVIKKNPNFKKEVEAFAGEGFLEENNIEID